MSKVEEQLKDRQDYRQTLIQRGIENDKKLKNVEEQIEKLKGEKNV